MAKFLKELVLKDINDNIWELKEELHYCSDILGLIKVPIGFQTDLASVPKIPIIYMLWGNRSHYEAVIHDYLYRKDSVPDATFEQANDVFFEAMRVRNKSNFIAYPMYWGVCIGGINSYHRRSINVKLSD